MNNTRTTVTPSSPPVAPAEPAGVVRQIAEPLLPSPITCAQDHADTIKTVGKVAMGTGAAVLVGMAVLQLFRR